MGAREKRSALRLGAVLLLSLWAQHIFKAHRETLWDGVLLYALAMALFAYQLNLGRERKGQGLRGLFTQLGEGVWQALQRRRWRLALAGLGCAMVWYAALAAVGRPWYRPFYDLLLLWGGGLASVLAAFAEWQRLPDRLALAWRCWRNPEALLVVALVALTIWLRAFSLETIPPVLSGDEASLGLEALGVLQGRVGNPFATGWLSHPSLYFFVQALSIRLMGVTTAALRLSSALISGGVTLFLYLLTRRLFGRGCALLASLYLALYHYAIHFGRLGLNNIWDPFWALGSLYLLTVGLEDERPLPALWAGLFSGLAIYFYLGARLVPILVIAYLGIWAWRERGALRRRSTLICLWGGMAALAALPLLAFFRKHPDQFTARWRWVGIFPSGWVAAEMARTGKDMAGVLWGQFTKAALAFTATYDPTFWYRPERPLLFSFSAILFVLGLTYCLVNWRQRAHLLMIAWFLLVIVFGGMLLENPPSSPRLVMAIPPVVIMVALGAMRLSRWASLWWRGRLSITWIVTLTLVALCGYQSVTFYYRVYTPQRMFSDRNTAVADAIGHYLRSRGPNTICYMVGAPQLYFGHATIPYLAQGVPGIDITQPLHEAELPEATWGAVFILLPEREAELSALQARYPAGVTTRHLDARGQLLFISYVSDE